MFKEYKIDPPEQLFKIDENGFSTGTAARLRAKARFDAKKHSNSVELNEAANVQLGTITPAISADGRAWSPLAVLAGKQWKHRTRPDGTR